MMNAPEQPGTPLGSHANCCADSASVNGIGTNSLRHGAIRHASLCVPTIDRWRGSVLNDNKTIVARWFKEFWGNPWNPDIIQELAAPDILVHYPMHEPKKGRAVVSAFMTDFRAAFPDLNFWRVGGLLGEGDYVVSRWEGGATLRRVTIRQGAKFMLVDADDERLTAGFHDLSRRRLSAGPMATRNCRSRGLPGSTKAPRSWSIWAVRRDIRRGPWQHFGGRIGGRCQRQEPVGTIRQPDQMDGAVASIAGGGACDQVSVRRAVIDRDPDATITPVAW